MDSGASDPGFDPRTVRCITLDMRFHIHTIPHLSSSGGTTRVPVPRSAYSGLMCDVNQMTVDMFVISFNRIMSLK